ncbi:MAG: sarcosine oxidase subunit gamma [Pseudomonadota bacterium]
MAEFAFTLTPKPLLGGVDLKMGANRIVELDEIAVVSIAVPLGNQEKLAKALKSGWSIGVPEPTLSTANGNLRAVRTGADQFMLLFPHESPNAEAVVQAKLKGAGYTTDQTDNWVVLEVSGPDVAAALERLSPVDLSVDAFPVGASARTVMEHMGAIVIRLDHDRFMLMSASSSAKSFLHAVETSFAYVMP